MTENAQSSAADDAFIERVASALRRPQSLDTTFDARLMARVRNEGARLYPRTTARRSWWRRPVVVRVTPIAGLAIAAGLAGIVALSTLVIPSRHGGARITPSSVAAATPDTVQVVRFVLLDPRARKVELVGDFNEWTKGVTELKPSGAPGVWEASVALRAGRHEYAFIINGSRWVADPLATRSSDEFGTESSVIRVGTGKSTT